MATAKQAQSSRDRFVGFAFASAHLLLETDNAGEITFAAGARCGLVTRALEELIGRSLFDCFPTEEHALLRLLLQRLHKRGKLDPTQLLMHSVTGQKFSAYLGACRLPNQPDRSFFSVSVRGQATGHGAGRHVPDLATFLPVLESRLVSAKATEISQALSMVLIDGVQNNAAGARLREVLEAYLLSMSSDGDSAVRLDDDTYAVLHSDDAGLEEIQRDITQLLAGNSGGAVAGEPAMWRVAIGKTELPTADVARAISYTLRKFANERTRGVAITSLDDAVQDLLTSTVQRVSRVREIVEQKNFRLVYQPIVRLTNTQIHHVEALIRVGGGSPAEFVAFAEDIGMITDVDLLVVQEALATLAHAARERLPVPDIAVNVAAASLASRLFMDQLEEIVRPFGELARKLLVDVTQFTQAQEVDVLKASLIRLRRLGIRRCLGDIGAEPGAFMSLGELNVDFAKIEGDAVASAMRDTKDRTILQSIIQICSHLGILVIAERVETEDQRLFLRSLGVNLGQGYLFGRPADQLPGAEAMTRGRARPE